MGEKLSDFLNLIFEKKVKDIYGFFGFKNVFLMSFFVNKNRRTSNSL